MLTITVCVNAFDEEGSSIFGTPQTRRKLYIANYLFDPLVLPASPLFKLPDTRSVQVLFTEGRLPPDEEFRAVVESEHLRGLVFDLLWIDEQESE